MEWWLALLIIFGSFIFLMLLGIPIAFCFLLINVVGVFLLWGGSAGLVQLIVSLKASVAEWILLPIPLFILMGEVMFRSGVAFNMIDALDKWLGRLPGRLGLLAVASGTIFSTMTGSSTGSTAMLGSLLTPEMEKRGYKKPMSLGPILGSGGLAMMIPPSGLAVFIAAIGDFSIGKTLIAIIIPGLLMAVLYSSYIIIRCWRQPSIAPSYEVTIPPLSEKLVATARYILPIGFIIFMVVGVILLGIATPTEAAATGAAGTFILAALYKRLTWKVIKESITGTLEINIMILMIIAGAMAFGQILAYTGGSRGLLAFVLGLPLAPILIIAAMQVVVLFLGMFMGVGAIIMICLPIFIPIVRSLGFDPVWFGVMFLLNIEIAMTSPPFGPNLFVMKSVAPPDTTMGDTIRAALPFIYLDLILLVLILVFPALALWLVGVMR